ncbi:DsbA family protein [Croceicoccus ponticola]|uniref:DsbA family protein n=1 Tax=Croceicoccus ponticola TaxID=2217664 RepID=A0A437GY99_9SPHN|nr:DsbA family protein [Croceicoccus ponticola]RVQ67641.1 DsbA family protein [Croceicoccus ponticola]
MTLAARPFRIAAAVVAILALALGAAWIVSARGAEAETEAGIAARSAGFDDKERAAIEVLVRQYLLENPEILPEMVDKLREKEATASLDNIGEGLFTAYPGAFLGNPKGSKVLVEFSDYACGYCRSSVAAVDALIAEDPELKVVIREFPILSQDSVEAAKWALAAAHQGKYAQFHKAMYDVGKPTPDNIEKAAMQVGLDLAAARKVIVSPAIAAEIEANRAFASQLQFEGTPAWVTGTQTMQGAVGKDALATAIEQAGSRKGG